ncbi:MAG: T9SS type A sorting domain-containing protein [Bacteroidota bacterium]
MKKSSTLLLASLTLSVASVFSQPVVFAGNGSMGYSGDGGLATQAELNWISGFAGDPSGNIYISDLGNADVRKVNAAGIISTYAGNQVQGYSGDGGAATLGSLQENNEIALDAAGNLYINDKHNYRIRKVTPGGVISTVAGTGVYGTSGDGGAATAATIYVSSMAIDPLGNIYISNASDHIIRKINTLGIITTVAGTGVAGFSGDGGAATAATLNSPANMAIDAAGNLFIADLDNYRIRKINTSGVISTYVGNGTFGYSGDGGIATAAQICESNGMYSMSGVSMPMAFNAANELYFVSGTGTLNNYVMLRKVSSAGIVSTARDSTYFAFGGNYVVSLNAIFIDANNSFYFCPSDAVCIGFIDPGTLYRMPLTDITTEISSTDKKINSMKLYPNPNSGNFTVETQQEDQNVSIYDVTGRLVFDQNLNTTKTNIDINTLPQGTYNIEVKGKGKTKSESLVIVK